MFVISMPLSAQQPVDFESAEHQFVELDQSLDSQSLFLEFLANTVVDGDSLVTPMDHIVESEAPIEVENISTKEESIEEESDQ